MGKKFIDYYSITHFIGGIILEKFNISFINSNILHFLFEIIENYILVPIQKRGCISLPPILPIKDCKNEPDTKINILGDQLSFIIGYLFSSYFLKNIKHIPEKYIYLLPLLPFISSLIMTNIIKINI
tara:strand:- start:2613 stop:2993 length:381 start_codon:yes stop_codon:yes gene_type:complete